MVDSLLNSLLKHVRFAFVVSFDASFILDAVIASSAQELWRREFEGLYDLLRYYLSMSYRQKMDFVLSFLLQAQLSASKQKSCDSVMILWRNVIAFAKKLTGVKCHHIGQLSDEGSPGWTVGEL